MIRFNCPNCQAAFRVRDSFAGERGECPRCGQPLLTPGLANPDDVSMPPGRRGPFVAYLDWCGGRSFVFQVVLTIWTGCSVLVAVLILLGANREVTMLEAFPRSVEGARQANWDAAIAGLACGFVFYCVVAIPLFIAAIATIPTRKRG